VPVRRGGLLSLLFPIPHMGRSPAAAGIDGEHLVFESMEGAAARLRFTWDATDPGVITWRNEMAVGDGSWFLIEEYRMVPR
jgi:hypothetical protein